MAAKNQYHILDNEVLTPHKKSMIHQQTMFAYPQCGYSKQIDNQT